MSGSVNKVILIGNLGRDPEVKSFQNGDRVAQLRVATAERWKDKQSGELREKTEWHQVALFSPHTIGFAEKYLRKGSKVFIEGKLVTRKWQDQAGVDRWTTEVVVQGYHGQLLSLDAPRGATGDSDRDRPAPHDARANGAGAGVPADDLDDDVPF